MFKKQIFVIFLFLSFSGLTYSQVQGENEIREMTIFERFLSKSGTMTTKDIYKFPEVWSSGSLSAFLIHPKVIRIADRDGINYFLTLTVETKNNNKFAAIIYSELEEINNAFKLLLDQSNLDQYIECEYRERYFATNEGFKIGYFQDKKKQQFFIEFNNYQSDDTFYFDINKINELESIFNNAMKKIVDLENQDKENLSK